MFKSHVVFDLFTFREHNILYNRDKFPCDITVGTTFRTDKKIPMKFLDIAFKKNKRKHPKITSRNLHILMKYYFTDICVIVIFQKKSNFPVTARDLIFYTRCNQKQTPEVFCKKRCSQKFSKFHRKTTVLEFLFIKVNLLK